MSNIIKCNNDLLMLSDDIKYIEKHGISKHHIKSIMKRMMPNDYINYIVSNKQYENSDVAFIPTKKIIEINMNVLESIGNKGFNLIKNDYNLKNEKLVKSYLFLIVLSHEIEHAYQFLMGENLADSPNKTIAQAYKDIYDIVMKRKFTIAKIIYTENQNKLLLERNAQIESYDLILKCAKYNNRQDIYDAFNDLNFGWTTIGYKKNNKGSIVDTYFSLSLFNKYQELNFDLDISEEEKIRYGFPISEETRQKLLKL